jgi:hypothetical protein
VAQCSAGPNIPGELAAQWLTRNAGKTEPLFEFFAKVPQRPRPAVEVGFPYENLHIQLHTRLYTSSYASKVLMTVLSAHFTLFRNLGFRK